MHKRGDEATAVSRTQWRQTLPRMQAEHVGDLQVALSDLTAGERAAFEAELASGALARLVLPWEPWWRLPEAQHLSLSAAGTRLLHDLGAPSCLSPCCIRQGTARHCFNEIDHVSQEFSLCSSAELHLMERTRNLFLRGK